MTTQTRRLQAEDVKAFRKRILLNCGWILGQVNNKEEDLRVKRAPSGSCK